MITWMRDRLARDESGFTLIELMVVVLIIAILIAIAIPTFLGARERAQDRAAQSDLRNSLTAAKVYYVDNEDYGAGELSDADFETALEEIEPSLDFVGNVTPGAGEVGFVRGDQEVLFLAQSRSSTWFCIADVATAGGGTTYNSGDASTAVDTVVECNQPSW